MNLPSALYRSSGFGIPSIDDDSVTDEEGKKRKISCGTEKSKHKSKNHRTAGICYCHLNFCF